MFLQKFHVRCQFFLGFCCIAFSGVSQRFEKKIGFLFENRFFLDFVSRFSVRGVQKHHNKNTETLNQILVLFWPLTYLPTHGDPRFVFGGPLKATYLYDVSLQLYVRRRRAGAGGGPAGVEEYNFPPRCVLPRYRQTHSPRYARYSGPPRTFAAVTALRRQSSRGGYAPRREGEHPGQYQISKKRKKKTHSLRCGYPTTYVALGRGAAHCVTACLLLPPPACDRRAPGIAPAGVRF
jgi:hypothetical protein